jgi:hypothetical protein
MFFSKIPSPPERGAESMAPRSHKEGVRQNTLRQADLTLSEIEADLKTTGTEI